FGRRPKPDLRLVADRRRCPSCIGQLIDNRKEGSNFLRLDVLLMIQRRSPMDASTKMQPVSELIDGIKALITPDVVAKASYVFGESEAAITKAFGAAFPSVLGALANKADDRSFMSRLFDLTKDPAADGSILDNVASLVGSGGSSSPAMSLGSRF